MENVCEKVFGSRRRFQELLVEAAQAARERSGFSQEKLDEECGLDRGKLSRCAAYEGDPARFTRTHFHILEANLMEFDGIPESVEDAIVQFLQIPDHVKRVIATLDIREYRREFKDRGKFCKSLRYGELARHHAFNLALIEIADY